MPNMVAMEKAPTATFVILSVPSKTNSFARNKQKTQKAKKQALSLLEIIMSSSSDNFSNVSCHNEEEPSHILILKGVYLDLFVKHVDFLSLIIIIRVYL